MDFSEFWLQSNNSKKLSLQNLRELKKSDLEGKKELLDIFNIFNTNGDEKLDKSELNSLFFTIKKVARSNKDGDASIFETDEAEKFINETTTSDNKTSLEALGVKAKDLFEFLGALVSDNQNTDVTGDIDVKKEAEELIKNGAMNGEWENTESLKDLSSDYLINQAQQANDLFKEQIEKQGSVSDFYQWYKEVTGDEKAATKVYAALEEEKLSALLIQKAREGTLTEVDYYKLKADLAQKLYDETGDEEFKQQAYKFEAILQKIEARDTKITRNPEHGKQIKHNFRLMTFEETFEKERGVKYDPKAIEEYSQKEAYSKMIVEMYNQNQLIKNQIEAALSYAKSATSGGEYMMDATRISELKVKVYQIFVELFGKEKVSEKLKEMGLEGELDPFSSNNSDESGRFARKAAEALIKYLENNFDKACNGKTLEEIQKEAAEGYTKAYGNKNSEVIALGFVQSQKEGVQGVKNVVGTTGMLVMIAGQFVPATNIASKIMVMGGLGTATVGGAAISAIEGFSQKGGMTLEEAQDIAHELALSIALTASGMKIGKMTSSMYGMLVLKNCPMLLAKVSEIGADATLSLISTYALTGELDLSGEAVGQLIPLLTGILKSKGSLKKYLVDDFKQTPTGRELPTSNKTKPRIGLEDNPTEKTNITDESSVVKVSHAKNEDDGFIVRIGDEEYVAKDFDEAVDIIKKRAPNSSVDLSALNVEKLCNDEGVGVPKTISDNFSQESVQKLLAYLVKRTDSLEVYMEAVGNITEQIKNGSIPSKSMLDEAARGVESKLGLSGKRKEISAILIVAMEKLDGLNVFVKANYFSSNTVSANSPGYQRKYDQFKSSLKKSDETQADSNNTKQTQQEPKTDSNDTELKQQQEAAAAKAKEEAELRAKQEAEAKEQQRAEYKKYSEKYPELVDMEYRDGDNFVVNVGKAMERYELYLKENGNKFDSDEIYRCLSSLTKDANVDLAFKFMKGKYHPDVIAHENKIKTIQDEYNQKYHVRMSEKSANAADNVVNKIKEMEKRGEALTEDKIDSLIEEEMSKNPNDFQYADRERIKQYVTEMSEVTSYIKRNLHPEAHSSLDSYNEYIASVFKDNPKKYKQVIQRCKDIYREFGVEVHFSEKPSEEIGSALNEVYKELHNFRMFGDNGSKMPTVIKFESDGSISKGDAYWDVNTNEIKIGTDGGKINSENVRYSLRHEFIHIKDTKTELGDNFPITFDKNNITEYAKELLRAGLSPDEIIYAFKNRKEFISIAAEGDPSKYSQTMQKLLEDCGMPEEVFKMSPADYALRNNKYSDSEIDTLSAQIAKDIEAKGGAGYEPSGDKLYNKDMRSVQQRLKEYNINISEFTNTELELIIRRIEARENESINTLLSDDFVDIYIDDIKGALTNAAGARKYAFAIEENGIFTPYKLSLLEINEIRLALKRDANGHINLSEIDNILYANNPELFNKLGSVHKYSDALEVLSGTLEKSVDSYSNVIPKKDLEFDINGKHKYIKSSENIPKGQVKKLYNDNYKELIESNMLTKEGIEIAENLGIEFTGIKRENSIYGSNTVDADIKTIVEKTKTMGIEALTTHELHALTDFLSNLYEKNPKFQGAFIKATTQKASMIYSYVNGIKSEADRILQGSNLEISDHCIMRMLDRDVFNVIDNTQPGVIVKFSQLIKTIKESANVAIEQAKRDGTTEPKFVISKFSGNGIEIMLKPIGNGKFNIDTIIPK